MTKRNTPDGLLSRLQAELEARFGVVPAPDAGTLLKTAEPASLRETTLVGAGHFDVAPHLLVLDPRLGTVGLVHVVGREARSKPDTVRRLVEQAAYLRHLMLTEWRPEGKEPQARTRPERPLPLTVELVLVIPPDDDPWRAALGGILGDIARRVALLHGIGVNLLEFGEAASADDGRRLRRAFCWLLTATRAWFEGAGRPAVRRVKRRAFTGLSLENWRLPGRRDLELDANARMHLVHGRNGSGKSSLVEAIEFAMTGRADRLAGEAVRDIVEYHPPGGPATSPAVITFREPWAWTYSTRSGKPPEPLPGAPVNAASFRLDQGAMDRLSGTSDTDRALCLLEAFFPDEMGARDAHRLAKDAVATALAAFPDGTWGDLPAMDDVPATDALLDRTAWVDAPELRMTEAVARDLLLLSVDVLRVLLPLAPEVGAILDLVGGAALPLTEVEKHLNVLDDALDRLATRAPDLLGHLGTASDALSQESLRRWQPRGEAPSSDAVQALNDWLEAAALADLARRQRAVLRSLRGAEEAKWKRGKEGKRGLFRILGLPAAIADELEEQLARWSAEEEERLQGTTRRGRSGDGLESAAPASRPALSAAQVESLDAVTPWLFHGQESLSKGLGRTIQEAIRQDKALRIGDAVVGDEGWAEALHRRVDALRGAVASIVLRDGVAPRSAARLAALRRLREALVALRGAEDAMSRSLLDRFFPAPGAAPADPGLIDALNELIALFTPARWAYDDFELTRLVDGNGRESLGMCHGGAARADLRLNTAELNLFTVALFLLCAPRIGNPLHLLVLDDPLQNMDELTATTLARGLAKVVELLDEAWTLMLLFHGEDDLERFRQEVPAAVYSLPWLTPAQTAEEIGRSSIKPSGRSDRKLDRKRQAAKDLFAPS
ncbi:ATP-binding protein [Azospirillum soli]|uniref:ATP-binding protein n=1 Tax=Azospirillum soli TaxID=1304799 RepID=UPI001AE84CCC|nr:ATP-binding protein [Azospirillum soli]MBP2315329.1 energy-coupling factor transporter ATP-binding protein EcfA2 [Azospirillum soli]